MVENAPMGSVADQVSVIGIGYAGLVTLLAGAYAIRRVGRPSWLDQLVWMLEALMVLRALIGAGKLAGGEQPDSFATHVGYLAASVCILPLAMQSVRGDRGTWAVSVVAVAALAITVIAVRIIMTE
jgi:heme A synthase